MSTLISASRFPLFQPVVRSRKFCAALSLLTALFVLLALPAAQAQLVESGAVAIAPSINTLAGNGTPGYSGDGGSAASAELNGPIGVAEDSMGNLYIADYKGQRIRVVAAVTGTLLGVSVTAGDIYTVAGNGTQGYSGDGGVATSAELNTPAGVAVDSAGDLYIADSGNQRIRMVTASTGKITTVAGNGTQGYSGDGGVATNAELSSPTGVVVDSVGDIYIADSFNNRVREVTVGTGVITTVAGNGTQGYSGDGSAATSAELSIPAGVALDHVGNLYIADSSNQRIRMVAAATGTVLGQSVTAGDIYTVAGDGTASYGGDGGLATSAALNVPSDVVLDGAGNLYIADSGNQRIRMVAASTGTVLGQSVTAGDIYTVAGDGTAGYSGDGGLATSAELNLPGGVAVGKGSLYIADTTNSRVREVSANTTLPTTAVGSNAASQNVFVELTTGGAISGVSVPKAQDGTQEFTVGPVTGCVVGSTINNAGTICTISITFSPQYAGQRTGEMTLSGSSGPIGTVGLVGIGLGPEIAGYPGALSTVNTGSTLVAAVTGVAVDGAGNLYIADNGNDVYEVSATSGQIVTVAGSTGGTGNVTTTPQSATGAILSPVAVAVDGAGNLYIADTDQPGVLEEVFAATGKIAIIAGGGTAVPSTTPQPAMSVKLLNVVALAVDGAGNVYITDQGRNEIDRINPAGELVLVAGGGGAAPSTSLQPATSVALNTPTGVAADDMGNLYISDLCNNVVERVNPAREIAIVAGKLGGGGTVPSPTPQPATSAQLNNPEGVAVDGAGNLYIADKNATSTSSMILQVTGLSTSNPQLVSVAGGGTTAPSATAAAATNVALPGSAGVAVDGAGDIYIADDNTSVDKVIAIPMPLVFPSTAFGSISPSQSIMLANIGNQALGFTSIGVTTNFSDTGTTCSGSPTLLSGAICLVDVQFAPTTGAAGTLTGALNIDDNNLNVTQASQQLSLSGTATGTPLGTSQAATPTFSPAAGTYTSAQSVTINDATSGATIYYTTNGTTPTTSSPVYSGPITVSATETVEAIATASGYTTSAVGSAIYTINTGMIGSFTMTASPNAMSIAPGATTGNSTSLTLATTNYNGTVTLSCSGLPANAYCSFPGNAGAQSQVVTLSGSNMSVALNIETSVATAPPLTLMQGMPSPFGPSYSPYSPANPSSPLSPILPALAFWWPGSMAGLAAFGRKRGISKTQQRMLQLCLLVLMTGVLAAGISGCGGSSSSTPAATHNTPAGTTTVTVTATPASGTPQTTTITLTIT